MPSGLPLVQLSAGALVGIIIVLVLTGQLVTRRALEDVRKDRDARLAEKDALAAMWRQAYEFEREARSQLTEQSQLSIEAAHTATAIARAVAAPAVEGDPDANAVA